MKVEFRNLQEIFSESSRDEEVTALVPLSSSLVFSEDGHWYFYPFSFGESSTKNKLSGFSPPFSLAVRTGRLAQCLLSLSVSGGFPGLLFRVLINRYEDSIKDAFGLPEGWTYEANTHKWLVFFDQRLGEVNTPYLESSKYGVEDLLVAEEEFHKRKETIFQHVDKAVKSIMSTFSLTNVEVPEVGYYPGILSFLSENAPGILFLSDFHPFYFNGIGVAKKMSREGQIGQRKNRMLNVPNANGRSRLPLLLAYLDFSEHLSFEDPIGIKILEEEHLANTRPHLVKKKIRELEEVWSVSLGKEHPIGVERVKILGALSSNIFYWKSLMETLGKLYILPKEKRLRVEDNLDDQEQKEGLGGWPELDFLSEEERRGLVVGHKMSSLSKGVRWANAQPIYFSPSLIFDYPNTLGNIKVLYFIPLAFDEGEHSNRFYFLPVIAFSGRLGLSTLFSGNRELGFDFILTHSYPVKEDSKIPYVSMSSVIQAEIEEPWVGGTTLSSYLRERGIKLSRTKEKIWSGATLYLSKGITPIPGVRFSTIYLPRLLEIPEDREKFYVGNLENLLDSLKGKELLSDDQNQGTLFPQFRGKEVYLVHNPFYDGEEVEFRERILDIISSSYLIVKKKNAKKTHFDAYVLKEDIRQEAMCFPVVVHEERVKALLSHQYFSPFRHFVGANRVGNSDGREGCHEREVNRKSSVKDELHGYMNFLPKQAREEVRGYLSYLFRAIGKSGFVIDDPPPPPPLDGLSVFALISEPVFHLRFLPQVQGSSQGYGSGDLTVQELGGVHLGFMIEAYPYWKIGLQPSSSLLVGSRSEKDKYLPSVPIVRFLRVNYYRRLGGPGVFVMLFVFHHGEVVGIGEEGYPLNTILPLII